MATVFNDVAHWEERAEEARIQAEDMSSPEARQVMLSIAADYDKLAKRATERLKGRLSND